MTRSIRTLLVLDGGIDHDLVAAAIPEQGVEIVARLDRLADVDEALEATRADLLLIACQQGSEAVVEIIKSTHRLRPERSVVVLCSGTPNGFVRRVFDAGADDIASLPHPAESVGFLLEKALARHGTSRQPARMVVVLGPKGGTGKTLTACNLAAALAEQQQRVALVDLDLQFGDIGLALGLRPERTIYDLASSGGSLDADKVQDYLVDHESGVRVLLAPSRPDQAADVNVSLLRELYPILREEYDYLIVDTPPGFTPEVIASVDLSTDLCMVGTLDTLSLKNARLGLETLTLMGYPESQVTLLLNRANTKVGITPADAEVIIGRAPDITVPSDREIPRAVNEGEPIVISRPKSEAAKAFRALADRYLPETGAGVNKGRRRMLARKA
jgi:pilus assembly protein CpaE